MIAKEEISRLRQYFLGDSCALFYPNDPLYIIKGKGTYLYDQDETPYLDCINNVASVGHAHSDVVEATYKQNVLLETNSRYLHPNIITLSQRLSNLLPESLHKFYFVNSGSEATDLALNLAFYYTKGTEVIVVDHAYHGHLMSAMAISPYKFEQGNGVLGKQPWVHVAPCPDTYRGKYNTKKMQSKSGENSSGDFQHLNGTIKHAQNPSNFDFGAAYAFEVVKIIRKIQGEGKQLAAFICESMISCGGQIVLPSNYLSLIYEEVRKAGGICIADEVQAGYGRCGEHFWAFQLQNVVPDMVTIGKPMGNGHPVAALITTHEISSKYAENKIQYFNTYGGNPVSCAAALAVLDVYEKENLMANSKNVGAYLLERLNLVKMNHPHVVGDVRGLGLFIGIELVKEAQTRTPDPELAEKVIYKMKDRKIIISREGPDENILKIKPPLCFSKADANKLAIALDEILNEMKER